MFDFNFNITPTIKVLFLFIFQQCFDRTNGQVHRLGIYAATQCKSSLRAGHQRDLFDYNSYNHLAFTPCIYSLKSFLGILGWNQSQFLIV